MRVILGLGLVAILAFVKLSWAQCKDSDDSFDFIIELLKRNGIQCVLERDACAKGEGSSGDIVEKLLGLDKNVESCMSQFKYAITNPPASEPDEPGPRRKDPNGRNAELIKNYCGIFTSLTKCLEPLHKIFRECKSVEGVSLFTFVNQACKENGKVILDMVQSDAKSPCFRSSGGGPFDFETCLKIRGNGNKKPESSLEYITKQPCNAARDVKDCVHSLLENCKNKEPKRVLLQFLQNLRDQNMETRTCLFDEDLPKSQFPVVKKGNNSFRPIKSKKHSRPTYFG